MNTPPVAHQRPSALQQAGISERSCSAPALHLGEIEDPVLVRLHSLENLPGTRLAALALPSQVGQTGPVGDGSLTALCLAPGEWLLVGSESATSKLSPDLADRLRQAWASNLTAVYDQSDGLAGLRVSGAAAPWLLSKLSCLDFARGATAGPHCARTRMGDAAVVVHYHPGPGDGWVFDLYVDRSIAHCLWELLCACAPHAAELHMEFGAFT